jgi:hypothetical protein
MVRRRVEEVKSWVSSTRGVNGHAAEGNTFEEEWLSTVLPNKCTHDNLVMENTTVTTVLCLVKTDGYELAVQLGVFSRNVTCAHSPTQWHAEAARAGVWKKWDITTITEKDCLAVQPNFPCADGVRRLNFRIPDLQSIVLLLLMSREVRWYQAESLGSARQAVVTHDI